MVQTGWATLRLAATGTSQYTTLASPGHKFNTMIIKNEDTTNTIWIKVGNVDTALKAVINEIGVGGSFPLAPGESLPLTGLEASHIAYITAAQATAWFKVLAYVARGFEATY